MEPPSFKVNEEEVESPLSLSSLVDASSSIMVVCGAGISVSCGVPDFRSPDIGIYNNLDVEEFGLVCESPKAAQFEFHIQRLTFFFLCAGLGLAACCTHRIACCGRLLYLRALRCFHLICLIAGVQAFPLTSSL